MQFYADFKKQGFCLRISIKNIQITTQPTISRGCLNVTRSKVIIDNKSRKDITFHKYGDIISISFALIVTKKTNKSLLLIFQGFHLDFALTYLTLKVQYRPHHTVHFIFLPILQCRITFRTGFSTFHSVKITKTFSC